MMSELPLTDRQRAAVGDLVTLIADCAQAERQIEHDFQAGSLEAETAHREARIKLESRYRSAMDKAEQDHRQQSKLLHTEYDSNERATQREYDGSVAKINEKADSNETAAKRALQEATWLAEAVFEANESQPIERFQTTRKGVDGKREALANFEAEAATLLKRYRVGVPQSVANDRPPMAEPMGLPPAPMAELDEQLGIAVSMIGSLRGLFLGKMFAGIWPLVLVVTLVFVAIIVMGAMKGTAGMQWLISGLTIGTPVAIVIAALLYFIARFQSHRLYRPLIQSIGRARVAADLAMKQAEGDRNRLKAQLVLQRDIDLKQAYEKSEPILAEIKERREHHLARLNDKYPKMLGDLKRKLDEDKYALNAAQQASLKNLQWEYETKVAAQTQDYERLKTARQSKYDTSWRELEARWQDGTTKAFAVLAETRELVAQVFPDWNDESWKAWQPPFEMAPVIQLGSIDVDLAQLPGGLPTGDRLKLPGSSRHRQPAMLGFPTAGSMLVEAGQGGRDEAVQLLQTVMFRLLTALPPGKVRFTIIDPVGLGQNFAGFMHLADYDGAYVTDRIWTEDKHIEQRLSDITEHMENVIQKYLRNEYQSISEYNIDAGEISEPFRFVVIANFPVNFSETAARRLASIANSGARCGVFTLITVDNRQSLPQGIQLADLRQGAVHLAWEKGRFVWKDEVYEKFPLSLDAPPTEDFVTEKLHLIGQAAKDAGRVEVPFDVIAPDEAEEWSRTSESLLTVALGRAGATKLQHLTLGVGTSQHALVAGKTGSGKSTLLHAMITNLSLWYSPHEVEFYLVDFKKGVEFKTYATHALPHARAVAIESDREFGLSVLQRLDSELKRRGNLFRDLGVQDLAGYRRSGHPEILPRTMLVIDEFQELFTEDDKLAQDASLLLDRLVRQGRAFGMHVLLGSQTLGGAYSLARSTINQMGVRIALQCSEADSYLILSDDNAAARLLSRPGEAIYNDASGMVEGNNPFQIVWLPETKREQCLKRVAELARVRGVMPSEPQIVFEGNVPAELHRNHLLHVLITRPAWPGASNVASAWLGEAIAIKDPTAAVLRRQAGCNLLIVGQREESALAMLTSSMLSLAAQHAPDGARFIVLDGSPPDSPLAGYLQRISANLPHDMQHVAYRDVPEAINTVATELDRRLQSGEADSPPIFIIIYGLQRYRQLRQEDDFSFSSSDGESTPKADKQFGDLLRDGPAHGIHTLAWCDTVNNVNRSLNRNGMREFENRVLFQMGATDSSTLIDTPLASKLGLHRALFYSEEQGTVEKFRPYALPEDAWLAEVVGKMKGKDKAPAKT